LSLSLNNIPEPTIDSWRPNLAIDFDGVIHSYENGWQGGIIYGTIVPGFFEWAVKAKKLFTLVIYSSRSGSHKMRQPMEDFIKVQLQGWLWDEEKEGRKQTLSFHDFTFASYKLPTFLTIDDRAITFKGDWYASELDPERLVKFKPWNQST
jgi:hypothetical protein